MAKLYKRKDNVYVLDVRGYTCPYPVVFTRKALSKVPPGTILEVIIDNPPSCETVPDAARKEGHEVVSVNEEEPGVWVVRIKVRR